MTCDEIVIAVHRTAGDIDPAALRYSRAEVVQLLVDTRRTFVARRVTGMSGLVITPGPTGEETITPDPDEELSTLLVLGTALALLRTTYRERIAQGTIGVSWRSGLDDESTISLQKAYEAELRTLAQQIEEISCIRNAGRAGARAQ